MDRRRITLIARNPRKVQRDWDFTNPTGSRIIFVDSLAFLPYALDRGVREPGYDVERVIIDDTGTPLQFLEFLATLPAEFTGDVVFLSDAGTGFLSSAGRGDGRVLYTMKAADIAFYLQTNSLTWPETAEEKRAPQLAIAQ